MSEEKLIKPKEVEVNDLDGKTLTVFIGRYPVEDGLEIIKNLMPSLKDILGMKSEEFISEVYRILQYVEVKIEGDEPIRLETKDLVNNHIGDAETALKIAMLSVDYNTNFFKPENLLNTLQKIQEVLGWSSMRISTKLSGFFSQIMQSLGANSKK